jgi:hypothetical protein
MKKFFVNKPRAWFLVELFLVSIILIAGLAYFLLNMPRRVPEILARVAGQEIKVQDLNYEIYSRDLIGSPDNPSEINAADKDQIVRDLIEQAIVAQEAKKNNLSVTDEDAIKELEKRDFADQTFEFKAGEGYTELEKEALSYSVKNDLLKARLMDSILGYREGEYVFFRFDKYLDYKAGNPFEIKDLGNEKLINEQKEHAAIVADSIYSKLEKKEINFEEAKKILGDDPLISANAFAPITANFHGVFTKDDFLNNEGLFNTTSYQGLKEKIIEVKSGQYTKPFILKAMVEGQPTDFSYVIAKITDSNDGEVTDFPEWLSNKSIEYNTEILFEFNPEEETGWLQRLKDLIFNKAQAGDATCSVSYAGSHKTDLQVAIYKRNATGGDDLYPSVPITISAGSSTAANGLYNYSNICGSETSAYSHTHTDDDGNLYIGDNDYTDRIPSLINCSKTSSATISLPSMGSGSWKIYLSTAADLLWYNGFKSSADGSATVSLKLGTTNNWANGTRVVKRVVWIPTNTTTNTYKTTSHINYWKKDSGGYWVETATANPGDIILANITVPNVSGVTIPDIWVRDNINNNGVNNTVGTGTSSDPYAIRVVSGGTSKTDYNSVCANTVCANTPAGYALYQNSGAYVTGSVDHLEWHRDSITPSTPAGDTYEDSDFFFKIPAATPYIDKYISNAFNSWGAPDGRTSSTCCTVTGISSNVGLLKIVSPPQNLTVKINIAGAGTITGGLGDESAEGLPFACTSTTGCTKTYAKGFTTYIQAGINSGYTFQNWSGCSTSTATGINVLMDAAKTCTANYAIASTSATLNVTTSPAGVATARIDGVALTTKTYTTTTSAQSYTAGYTITNTAYIFSGWTGTGCPTGTFTVGSTGTVNCTANFVVAPLFCTVTPQTGLAPLVVSATVSGGVAPYDFDWSYDGTNFNEDYRDRFTPVYWSYSVSGQYTVGVKDTNEQRATCSPTFLDVKAPQKSDGGETAP